MIISRRSFTVLENVKPLKEGRNRTDPLLASEEERYQNAFSDNAVAFSDEIRGFSVCRLVVVSFSVRRRNTVDSREDLRRLRHRRPRV